MSVKSCSSIAVRSTPRISAPNATPVGRTSIRSRSRPLITPYPPRLNASDSPQGRLPREETGYNRPMDKYEFAVLGLGAMGRAATFQFAKRGRKVLGIDQFTPPHAFGSSHGETRITRLAIGEGIHYTPLVTRSHEIWREIEKETGTHLLTSVGGLMISSRASTAHLHVQDFFQNTV